jgi:hypothetical protein
MRKTSRACQATLDVNVAAETVFKSILSVEVGDVSGVHKRPLIHLELFNRGFRQFGSRPDLIIGRLVFKIDFLIFIIARPFTALLGPLSRDFHPRHNPA